MSELDLAWAAGLFEGEGTISIAVRNSDETYRLLCCVGNTDHSVIDFFQERWPGWIQPAYGERPNRKPAWTWTVAGPKAEAFVTTLRPALRTARVRDKADLALRFRSHQSRIRAVHTSPEYRAEQRAIYLAMKALNLRGLGAAPALTARDQA